MEELSKLYTEVNTMHKFAVMGTNTKFKSEHAQGFTSGMEYAFRCVLKMIEERFKEED